MRALLGASILALTLADGVAQSAPNGGSAFHAAYGVGCHRAARESCYWYFADAASAAAALPGRRLDLTRTASGYDAAWSVGGYRAPTAAAAPLPPSDDGQVAVVLPTPLPTPNGAAPTVWVHSNGIVALGPGIDGGSWNTPPNDFTPSPSFRNAPDAAFFAWHDWNPAEAGSGRIVTEHVVTASQQLFCITWHGVENFPAGVANRGTFQFQFDLGTGNVSWIWLTVDGVTASPFGTAHLVGYSPGGPSLDPGPLPLDTPWSAVADTLELALTASPPPVSTSALGTLVRYDLTNVPEVVAASTVRLGYLILSFAAVPGLDLGGLGAPGCSAYVANVDLAFLVGGTTASLATNVWFPPSLPSGLDVFAQAIAMLPPQPVGAQQNSLGLVSSNGIVSHVAAQ